MTKTQKYVHLVIHTQLEGDSCILSAHSTPERAEKRMKLHEKEHDSECSWFDTETIELDTEIEQ